MNHKKSKSYIHKYPHLRYDINKAHEMYDCERYNWLTVNDSYYAPCYKEVIWFMKHKDLMPYMKSGKEFDAFMEYIYRPRNLRKTLSSLAKHYITLIIRNWEASKKIHDLDEELKKISKKK